MLAALTELQLSCPHLHWIPITFDHNTPDSSSPHLLPSEATTTTPYLSSSRPSYLELYLFTSSPSNHRAQPRLSPLSIFNTRHGILIFIILIIPLHNCFSFSFSFTQSQPPLRSPLPLRPCFDFAHDSGSSPYIFKELVDSRHVKIPFCFSLLLQLLVIMPPRRSHKKSRAGCRRCKNRKIKVCPVDSLLMPLRIVPYCTSFIWSCYTCQWLNSSETVLSALLLTQKFLWL